MTPGVAWIVEKFDLQRIDFWTTDATPGVFAGG